jgi:hypothetical protein
MGVIMTLAFSLLTWTGPIIGGIGYLVGLPTLFWIGVAFTSLNLFMNVASGTMQLPLLPLACIIIGSVLIGPWYYGASVGLLTWTAIEAVSESWPIGKRRRREGP